MSTASPEQMAFLEEALAAAAVLDATDRLGVLACMETGPVTANMLVRECALGERGARWLLAALAALGAAEAVGDGSFRIARSTTNLLPSQIALWRGLADALSDAPLSRRCDTTGGAAAYYPEVVPYMSKLFASAAEDAASRLSERGLRVLDVGAGAAPWSIALARRDPECRVTALDLPAVLAVTQRAVTSAALEKQFDYLAADLFVVDLASEAYDLAIVGSLCHLFDETTNQGVLKRLYLSLRQGGRVAIVDEVPNERLDGPRPVLLHALSLLLRTRAGAAYPLSTYVVWLREAGFQAIERSDLKGVLPLTLITADRA